MCKWADFADPFGLREVANLAASRPSTNIAPMTRLATAALVLLLLASPAVADDAVPPGFDPQRHMRVSVVRPCMKAFGLSVFRGTKFDRFSAEVISILRTFTPKLHVLL